MREVESIGQAGVGQCAHGVKATTHISETLSRGMATLIEYDPMSPPMGAMVYHDEAAMLAHLDTPRNPKAPFLVRTRSGECRLTPSAPAAEIGFRAFRDLCACEECWHEPERTVRAMDDLKAGLRTRTCGRTGAPTHLSARWEGVETPECRAKVLHTLLRRGADAGDPV